MSYNVKDIELADKGKKQIEWAASRMQSLMKIKEQFEEKKPLEGTRVGMALHITKETANLVKTLKAGGAEVAITGCNPLSTQDEVAAALAQEGFNVYGWKGETKEEYYDNLEKVADFKPNITIDDGCDLVNLIHNKKPELIENIYGGAEETTTGVIRLRAMEKDNALNYPMIAVNESKTKKMFDNFFGTGQSTLDGILRATNILFAGKTVVVCGYGNCGKGVATKAKGLGALVIVTEVDPVKALQARMDGFQVMPINEASKKGDVFITVTGDKHVIDIQHMKKMKDGAILANAGHFNLEINVDQLEEEATGKRKIRESMIEYTFDGKKLFLLAEGRLVNLAAAEGHPSEVMALSFCNQSLACKHIVDNKDKLENKVYTLPEKIDKKVAQMKLDSMGISIDKLTEQQNKYLSSYGEGT